MLFLTGCTLLCGCEASVTGTEGNTSVPGTTASPTPAITTTAADTETTSTAATSKTTAKETTAATTITSTTTATTTATTTVTTTVTTTSTTAALRYYEALEGKKLVVFGDSTVYGHTLGVENTWSALLANKYGMAYSNKGLNGSGIFISTMDNREPMYTRYISLPADADILFVMGGTNDYYKKAPLGTVNDTEPVTFAGALNTMIEGLKAKYPNTLILFSTPYYKNAEQHRYSEMVMAVCAKQDILCFDATDKAATGIRQDEAAFRAQYHMSATDQDHLNRAGMELVMPVFERFIGEAYTAYLQQ